jgi:hypothetical protein
VDSDRWHYFHICLGFRHEHARVDRHQEKRSESALPKDANMKALICKNAVSTPIRNFRSLTDLRVLVGIFGPFMSVIPRHPAPSPWQPGAAVLAAQNDQIGRCGADYPGAPAGPLFLPIRAQIRL